MKKILAIGLAAAMLLCLFACGSQSDDDPTKAKVTLPETSASLEVWEQVRGNFAREGSSQYNNATLQMMYLDNSCVMFEFRLMEGSEATEEEEEWARDLVLPFVLLIDENGFGQYESDPEAEEPLTITLALSQDGQTVTAIHTGNMPIACDGVYEFSDEGLEVSETAAAAILDHLPTAATSLNHNLGEFTMTYSDEVVFDWFYPVEATFDDTGVALAKFIIAKDLSAVYRVDDDIDPVLIFGSAQSMMDYESYVYPEEEEENLEAETAVPLVSVQSDAGVSLAPEDAAQLVAVLPWALDYTIAAESSDPSVLKVEGTSVKAIAPGSAIISGTLTVDDGSKAFSMEMTVSSGGDDVESEPAAAEDP